MSDWTKGFLTGAFAPILIAIAQFCSAVHEYSSANSSHKLAVQQHEKAVSDFRQALTDSATAITTFPVPDPHPLAESFDESLESIPVASGTDSDADVEHAKSHGASRSPMWPATRQAHITAHPACAACGFVPKKNQPSNQVHHKIPFHLHEKNSAGEDLELDPENLITLCGPGHWNCHLHIGHLGNFHCWNEAVDQDSAYFLSRIASRKCD